MRRTRTSEARGPSPWRPIARLLAVLLAAAVLHGCGPAWSPIEKRKPAAHDYPVTRDGHYRVRRGDSLYTIAFHFGLDWRDIAKWNGISSPYVIYPDQELRMTPPPSPPQSAVVTRPAQTPRGSTSRNDETAAAPPAESPAPAPASAPATPAPAPAEAPGGAKPVGARTPDPSRWQWPSEGRLLSGFKPNDPSRNGIDIAGREGQPVLAAAAGEVVYSGSGLIGYGELIIIKHSDRMLSAYAHNRRRLVAEGQSVAAGQQVSEMGRNDRNQALLHFEIRVNGTPQDPLKYLPKR